MSEKLESYLSTYIKTRVGVFKKYILAAHASKDQCVWYLEASEGMIMPSSDLKNCELLRDAQIFNEDIRISRNGRNTYKIFCLTELGKQIAEQLRKESEIAQDSDTLKS
jgi:hypothetical protein